MDLDLDDDLQGEVHGQLGKKASKRKQLDGMSDLIKNMEYDESNHKKRLNKQEMKEQALKQKYDKEIQAQKMKKFSNSSYLTPEAASYINDIMRSGGTKADEEIIFAGLHDHKKKELKFKKNEQFSAKYTKGRQQKRKKKGRFG